MERVYKDLKKFKDDNTQKIVIYSYSLTLIIPTTSSMITSPRKVPRQTAPEAKTLTRGIRALATELARARTAKL